MLSISASKAAVSTDLEEIRQVSKYKRGYGEYQEKIVG